MKNLFPGSLSFLTLLVVVYFVVSDIREIDGFGLFKRDTKGAMSFMDKNHDGMTSLDEFIGALEVLRPYANTKFPPRPVLQLSDAEFRQQATEEFQGIDQDGNGFLSLKEMDAVN